MPDDDISSPFPFYALFTRLREADFKLGIDDFMQLRRALEGNISFPDRDALRRLCRLLWAKSLQEGRLLDHFFDRYFPEPIRVESPVSSAAQTKGDVSPSESPSSPDRPDQMPPDQNQLATTPDPEKRPRRPPPPENVREVPSALPMLGDADSLDPLSPFRWSDEYYPITRRQMKRYWRNARQLVRQGPGVELDVAATVQRAGLDGVLATPVMQPRRANQLELLLLIDRKGSMVAFHDFADRLRQTAMQNGQWRRLNIYYFHNVPTDLYQDPNITQAVAWNDVVSCCSYQRTCLIILSDAGAARMRWNADRISVTKEFLEDMGHSLHRMVWMNPMPDTRWQGTSAQAIHEAVRMFPCDRVGMENAIHLLRRAFPAKGE